MKLQLFFLVFPVFLLAQKPRILVLEPDSILKSSKWFPIIEQDIQTLGQVIKDSILSVEMDKVEHFYQVSLKEYMHRSCTYVPSYEMELEQKLEERQRRLKQLSKDAEQLFLVYKNSLIELWEKELRIVIDSIALREDYDLVLCKPIVLYESPSLIKEQAQFQGAILQAIDLKIDRINWETQVQSLKQQCVKNIQDKVYIYPIEIREKLLKLDVFRQVILLMHGAKLT